MADPSGRAYLAGLALGLAVISFAGGLALPPLAAHGDFAEQWAAARVALEGGNPYDPVTWRADAARLAGRASDAAAFVYPPYVTFALVPLAALPLAWAATLWVAASLGLAAFALRELLRAFPPPHPLVAFGFGFAVFASGASLLALAQGQWDFLLLAAVAWGVVALGRAARSSACVALLMVKPQLAAISLLGFAAASAGVARRRYVTGVAVVIAAIFTTAVKLDWWGDWARGAASFQAARPIRTATVGTLFEPLGIAAIPLTIGLIALVIAVTLRSHPAVSLPRWLAAGVLVAPYVQAYDHLLLIAPLAMATSNAGRSVRSATILAATGLVVLVVGDLAIAAATSAAGRDVLGALVPLAIWLLIVVAHP